jgi:hypothetical protein
LVNPDWHYQMALDNGEQKIFIWIDFSPETEVTILHGVHVAMILNKEICLLWHPAGKIAKVEDTESRLHALTEPIAKIVGSGRVHYLLALLPLQSILTEMAEEYDALLLVAHKKNSKELLKQLPYSGFPFLFVSSGLQIVKSYLKIAVPIGYMKKSKDLALWSSYFARHNAAVVTLLKTIEMFGEDNRMVMNNLFSIERLFKNFQFPYEVVECHTATWKIQKTALEHALSFQHGLLIISYTYSSSFIDRIFKINDAFVIDHSEDLCVMCINSQRDLYTFCG